MTRDAETQDGEKSASRPRYCCMGMPSVSLRSRQPCEFAMFPPKAGHETLKSRCPLYPRKRTLPGDSWMSALCQKQTFCGAAKLRLFDHLIGECQLLVGHLKTK